MLNPFPGLLVFGFFAPTILRIGAAVIIASIAEIQRRRRDEIANMPLPFIRKMGPLVWVVLFIEAVIVLALAFGFYTQIAALLGLVIAIKHFIFQHRYARAFPLSRSTYFLLGVICLSLMLSGAGALAMDLPL